MAYYFYLDKVLLPIAPSSVSMQINNKNKTMNMINEGEINLLKSAGLTDVEFDVSIPQVKYPFAYYRDGFKRASYYLDKLESLKVRKLPFQFIVTRSMPNGNLLFDTNMKVSLEEYEIKEHHDEGMDLVINIRLKQYREFGTKTAKIKFAQAKPNAPVAPKPKVTVQKTRSQETSPKPKTKAKTHKVVRGDTLWAISKKYYGAGNWANVNKIVNANKGKIKNANLIYPGQVFTIPV